MENVALNLYENMYLTSGIPNNGKKQTQIYFLIKILIRIFKLLNKAIQIYSKYTVETLHGIMRKLSSV